MYVLHIRMCMCMCNPGRPARCGKWFLNERISRSSEPCSSPLHAALRAAPRAAYRDATATAKKRSRTGPCKKGCNLQL